MAQMQAYTIEGARKDIEATYNFDPTTMSFAQQAEIAPSLSALWSRYKRQPDPYHSALTTALAAAQQPEMLYCDGGMLLLAASKAPEDRKLGLDAVARCTLAEIQQTPYFYTMHDLARDGVDTFDLQLKMLAKPRFSAFVVAHAMNLGQNYAFVYPLLVQDEARYVPRVGERMNMETDPVALKTLALALLYAATPESERILRSLADASAPSGQAARDAALPMVERIDAARSLWTIGVTANTLRWRAGFPTGATEAEIRAKRKARMRSISDEALHDLDLYTPLLYRSFK